MSAAQWSLWCTPKPDGAQAFAPTPHPATMLACLLTGPCQGDSQPPDQAGGSLPASLCLGALYCLSLALSLQVPPWSSGPGASRGLTRIQSWQEMERRQALCPQTHKHSLEPAPRAQRLGIYVLTEGVWRLLSPALTSHSVPGLEPGQLGVGEGTSGSSCAPRGVQAGPPTLLSFHKVGSQGPEPLMYAGDGGVREPTCFSSAHPHTQASLS